MDPLHVLPAEIVLRIIDFSPTSAIAALTRLTRSWHQFEETHQEAIFSSPSRTFYPHGQRGLSFLSESQSFVEYFEGTASWKDLCKRQTLLRRNWNRPVPSTQESIIQVGSDAVWRFRVDWKERFILSTSMQGGLNVVDLDTGRLLWRLSRDHVKPFAHLEYEDGTAVFDIEENGLEVWTTGHADLRRGAFRRLTTLAHSCTIRGFQLSYQTLCVVSDQGQGFAYDMSSNTPRLKRHLNIEDDATGHLYQDSEVVMYCMGKKGYDVYDKATGNQLGVLDPTKCKTFYCIPHPEESQASTMLDTGDSYALLSTRDSPSLEWQATSKLRPIKIQHGPIKDSSASPVRNRIRLEDDEWGAGVMSGSKMVGISRGGRMFVCLDWQKALSQPEGIEKNSYIIDCDAHHHIYDVNLGGWLSIRDDRALFEIQDRIYVIALPDGTPSSLERPSFAFNTSSNADVAVPVSFMGIYDDCIMCTYVVRNSPYPLLLPFRQAFGNKGSD